MLDYRSSLVTPETHVNPTFRQVSTPFGSYPAMGTFCVRRSVVMLVRFDRERYANQRGNPAAGR